MGAGNLRDPGVDLITLRLYDARWWIVARRGKYDRSFDATDLQRILALARFRFVSHPVASNHKGMARGRAWKRRGSPVSRVGSRYFPHRYALGECAGVPFHISLLFARASWLQFFCHPLGRFYPRVRIWHVHGRFLFRDDLVGCATTNAPPRDLGHHHCDLECADALL